MDPDPDPAFHSNAYSIPTCHSDEDSDPDPTFQFDADPDPTTHFFPDMDPLMLQKLPSKTSTFSLCCGS